MEQVRRSQRLSVSLTKAPPLSQEWLGGPRVSIAADAGHFSEDLIRQSAEILGQQFDVSASALYQFNEAAPAKVVLDFAFEIFTEIGVGVAVAILYDAVKRLISKIGGRSSTSAWAREKQPSTLTWRRTTLRLYDKPSRSYPTSETRIATRSSLTKSSVTGVRALVTSSGLRMPEGANPIPPAGSRAGRHQPACGTAFATARSPVPEGVPDAFWALTA
jgi:hypothetical protein